MTSQQPRSSTDNSVPSAGCVSAFDKSVRPARRAAIAATGAITKQYRHPFRDPSWIHYPDTTGKYERSDRAYSAGGCYYKSRRVATADKAKSKCRTLTEKSGLESERGKAKKSSSAVGMTKKRQPFTTRAASEASTSTSSTRISDIQTSSAVKSPDPIDHEEEQQSTLDDEIKELVDNALYGPVPSTSSQRRFWQDSPTGATGSDAGRIRRRGPPLFAPLSPSLDRDRTYTWSVDDSDEDEQKKDIIPGPAGMSITAPPPISAAPEPLPQASIGSSTKTITDHTAPYLAVIPTSSQVGETKVNIYDLLSPVYGDSAGKPNASHLKKPITALSTDSTGGMEEQNIRAELDGIQQGIQGVLKSLTALVERADRLTDRLATS